MLILRGGGGKLNKWVEDILFPEQLKTWIESTSLHYLTETF